MVEDQDFETLSDIAHSLKSVAGNLEANQLQALSLQVQESGRAGKENWNTSWPISLNY